MTLAVRAAGALAPAGAVRPEDEVLDRAATRLADDPKLAMRVNADRTAALRHVLPLISRLEALGARDVVIVVTPNPPKRP
jgi:biopolymer transport protein ExbD